MRHISLLAKRLAAVGVVAASLAVSGCGYEPKSVEAEPSAQTEGPEALGDLQSATVNSWTAYNFALPAGLSTTACTGARFIGYSSKYGKWVGAALCGTDSTRYKLFMSNSQTGPYHQLADYSGHGQDHCELVNPNFTLPNDDVITSGGCTNCTLGPLSDPINVPVFARSRFGEAFPASPQTSTTWGDLSTDWYACGVSISPPPAAVRSWTAYNFALPAGLSTTACTGARFIGYSSKYGKWVGAALCGTDSTRYKLFMSNSQTGPYQQLADYAGHGQDHCELVNPNFTLPNEDSITSGGCTNCALGPLTDPINVPVFARARFGEAFPASPQTSTTWGDLTTDWYACGVFIQ